MMDLKRKISFKYDGKSFFDCNVKENVWTDGNKTVTEYLFDDGLKVTNIMTEYPDYDAYEWVNWFENTSDGNSKMISEVNDCDVEFDFEKDVFPASRAYIPTEDVTMVYNPMGTEKNGREDFYIHAGKESNNRVEGLLTPFKTLEYVPTCGKSSGSVAPFFNINKGENGVIAAIGWTGRWNCKIQRKEESVSFKSGIYDLNFYLKPHEKIRTSSVVIMFYDNGRINSQNKWRRLLKDRFSILGKPGRPKNAPLCVNFWGGMTSDEMIEKINKIGAADMGFEYVWIDAGWNGDFSEPSPNEYEGEWSGCVGDWRVNAHHHADGLLGVKDAILKNGLKFLLWFEPERANCRTPIVKEHPEWFLTGMYESGGFDSLLLNLGNEEALDYCIKTVGDMIEKLEISCYRQDFNIDPLRHWNQNDEENRKGILQIKHIMGLYKFWDALLERFPHLFIDNCAGGGQRIDIETLRRSVPLWRTDAQCPANPNPEVAQANSLSFGAWMPYSATGLGRIAGDAYRIRSAYGCGLSTNYWYSATDDFDEKTAPTQWVKKYNEEFKKVRNYISCDIYPLTAPGLDNASWCAVQYDNYGRGDGVLLAFKREESPYVTANFRLGGICADKTYQFKSTDGDIDIKMRGEEIIKDGFTVKLTGKRESVAIFYETV